MKKLLTTMYSVSKEQQRRVRKMGMTEEEAWIDVVEELLLDLQRLADKNSKLEKQSRMIAINED